MAEYRVVEVTHLDAGRIAGGIESERINIILGDFCPAGWEIVSARTIENDGIQRALVLLSR